jgi:hypothetical protein
MMDELKRLAQTNGCAFVGRLVPTSGRGRTDFHDRRLTFMIDEKAHRVTVLLTGGIDRYMEAKFECSIVVHQHQMKDL